ncbi:MAG: L-aspartate oxidase [Victivallaceae bacterium]|nr:L-aspartate oxidase [Victivallaceae bacterium]MDD4180816.1 L-aspartate oxidase [Victivallaceae bacterium]
MKIEAVSEVGHLIIGSGLAGLSTALQLAEAGEKVTVVTKSLFDDCNTKLAQGGIACVWDDQDTFDEHIADTLEAGGRLCNEEVARTIIEAGPDALKELIGRGTRFTTRGELGASSQRDELDLGREGGHHKRRVLHSGDVTGAEVQRALVASCQTHPNIEILENHMAIDLITKRRIGLKCEDQCLGVYVLDHQGNSIKTFLAISTTIASGSPGKVYLYTSNDDIACGDGLAMCYRAGLPIANMEFIQFHPTILYHPKINSFLISEAVRGEGAILKCRDASGKMVEFMDAYHPMKSLAPRDVVARAIDGEMKRRGEECVFLDIRHHSEATLKRRFPNIFAKCLEADINMSKDLIPVVPAEHYSCGGVRTDVNGFTGMRGLYAVGEVACTGLHGANRLASNSLLEALVVPRFLAKHIMDNRDSLVASRSADQCPAWSCGNAQNSDEMVVISHNWEELRRFMWDYVGIFRTNRRLERAKARIQLLRSEIERFYWDFLVSRDLLELRNIACVAEIIIDSAMSRKESRGLHYNADYPELNPQLDFVDTIIQKKI